jgi:hypothetical protein
VQGRGAAELLLPHELKGAHVQRLAAALVLMLGEGANESSNGAIGGLRSAMQGEVARATAARDL